MTPDQPSDPPRRFLDLDGGRLAYTDEGQGPAMLAIHGLPGSVRDWRWLAPALGPDLRLIRVELPGLGESDAALSPPRVEPMADLLAQACHRLGLSKVTVLCHSFGSTVAVAMAHAHPDLVARLALLAPVGLRPHRSFRKTPLKSFFRLALSLPGGPALFGPLLRAAIVRFGFPKRTTVGESVATFQLVGGFRFADHRAHIAALRQPSLLAWTADDPLVEAEIVAELSEQLPAGPRLTWPEGGHNLQKTKAVELGEALRDFVGSLSAPGG